jgi:hypothetical protein
MEMRLPENAVESFGLFGGEVRSDLLRASGGVHGEVKPIVGMGPCVGAERDPQHALRTVLSQTLLGKGANA